MKIAITSMGDQMNAPFDYRFGHAPDLVVLDSKNLEYKLSPVLIRNEASYNTTYFITSIADMYFQNTK